MSEKKVDPGCRFFRLKFNFLGKIKEKEREFTDKKRILQKY